MFVVVVIYTLSIVCTVPMALLGTTLSLSAATFLSEQLLYEVVDVSGVVCLLAQHISASSYFLE